MNIKDYKQRKIRGLVRVERCNDAYKIIIKRFDPNTGDEIDLVEEAIDIDEITNHISDLDYELEDLYELLGDM